MTTSHHKRCHKTVSRGLGLCIGALLSGGIMEIYTSKEYAEKLNVSEIWIRELARKGRIYPVRKVGRYWVFFGNSTVVRPPERWNRYASCQVCKSPVPLHSSVLVSSPPVAAVRPAAPPFYPASPRIRR